MLRAMRAALARACAVLSRLRPGASRGDAVEKTGGRLEGAPPAGVRGGSPVRLAAWVVAVLVSALVAEAQVVAPEKRRSGYADMSATTKAMQDDDTANPGMLSVLDGAAFWSAMPRRDANSCAGCHGDAKVSMKGVAARYPAFDERTASPITLEGRINRCRVERQGLGDLDYENVVLLALTALIAHQSRGQPIAEPDPRLAPFIETGRKLYERRQGQLNLACVHCHDQHAGQKLGGVVMPQGHPTGYPIYRLEWQAMGSLQRRLRNCLSGMRAENSPFGSTELVALETYLAWRARGMTIETPAVRP